MKIKPIFILFFSLIFLSAQAQRQDSVKAKYHYKPNFMVGVDLLNAGIGFFSPRKSYQGFVSSKVRRDVHAVAVAGYERNLYQKSGYDAEAKGPFVKIGAFYMLAKDPDNELNGFYAGGRFAGAFYRQEYRAVPVRGYKGADVSVPFPASTQSSYWIEATVGGRVQLFRTKLYVDVTAEPRYLAFSTKQDELKPMIVPGFGKSSAKFNMGFTWSLAYSF